MFWTIVGALLFVMALPLLIPLGVAIIIPALIILLFIVTGVLIYSIPNNPQLQEVLIFIFFSVGGVILLIKLINGSLIRELNLWIRSEMDWFSDWIKKPISKILLFFLLFSVLFLGFVLLFTG